MLITQGQTPLHYAAKHDAVNMIDALVSQSADINARDCEVRAATALQGRIANMLLLVPELRPACLYQCCLIDTPCGLCVGSDAAAAGDQEQCSGQLQSPCVKVSRCQPVRPQSESSNQTMLLGSTEVAAANCFHPQSSQSSCHVCNCREQQLCTGLPSIMTQPC